MKQYIQPTFEIINLRGEILLNGTLTVSVNPSGADQGPIDPYTGLPIGG